MSLADAHEKLEDWPLSANACIRLPGNSRTSTKITPIERRRYQPVFVKQPEKSSSRRFNVGKQRTPPKRST